MQIQLGNESVTALGGSVNITNSVASGSMVEDSYDVRASAFMFSGPLLGHNLEFFRFLIVDSDGTMLSSTALPVEPGFVTGSDHDR